MAVVRLADTTSRYIQASAEYTNELVEWQDKFADTTSRHVHTNMLIENTVQASGTIPISFTARYQTITSPTVTKVDVMPTSDLSERELVEKHLQDAGLLLTDIETLEIKDAAYLTDDLLPAKLPLHTPTWAEMLDEDRGEY